MFRPQRRRHLRQPPGEGVAAAARSLGIEIVGEARWQQRGEDGYRALFGPAKAARADCVYLGGIYDNSGDKLIRDKVAVLGDNAGVKLIAPDGFAGYPDLLKRPEAAGAYLSASDLPIESLTAVGGLSAQFLADYRKRYGREPAGSDVLYGVTTGDSTVNDVTIRLVMDGTETLVKTVNL